MKAPAAVTRVGYDFGGWYLDPAFSAAAAFPFTPSADTVFYAKWIPTDDTVTVNFYFSAGLYYADEKDFSFPLNGVEPISVKAGDKLAQTVNPPDFTHRGKTMTFSFWCFEPTWGNEIGGVDTQPILFPYFVPQNAKTVTLYAAFVEKRANETISSLTVHREDGEKDTVMYNYAGKTCGAYLDSYSSFQPVFSVPYRGEPLRAGYKATGYYKTKEFVAENVYKAPFLLEAGENHV